MSSRIVETTFIKDATDIDIDDIGYIENLLKLVFIVKKCENLKAVINGGDLTRNTKQKKTSDALQVKLYRSSLYHKSCRRVYFFNKEIEYCESVR